MHVLICDVVCIIYVLQTQFVDVIAINRYYGWYNDPGHPEVIHSQVRTELDNWYNTHHKPMLITEYGAGSVAGIHEVSLWPTCITDTVHASS